MADLLPREGLNAQVGSNRAAVTIEGPSVLVRQRHLRSKLQEAAQMINDDRRDLFHRWEVMKSLEALQQGQKTESVLIGPGAALCELSFPLRGRKRLLQFAGGDGGAESRIRGALG